MYALSASAECDCYRCVPPDPGIAAAALGASESSLPGTAPAEALHTLTLILSSGSTPFLVSPLVAPDSSVAPPPGSPLPSTTSWHALPSPCLWSSQVSASPPPSPSPPCLPCVEGRQRAAPHSSSFPPTPAPLQTLHMDVWGPARSVSSSASVMEVARTSMIHAAAPHFLWPFAVRHAVHQLNLWPRVSLPKTSPTLCWTGKVGDASVFRVWGSRAFVRDTSTDKLSARAIPCSVPFYRLFPYRSTPPPPPPLFLALGPPPVDPLPNRSVLLPQSEGAGSGDSEPGGEESGDAETAGVEPGGAAPEGVESGGAVSEGAESWGVEPRGAASCGGPAGASPRLSPQQLREWLDQRAHLRNGATGAGGTGGAGAGGAGVTAGAGGTGGTATAGPEGARTRGTGAAGTGGVEGAGAGDPTEPGAAGEGGAGAGSTGAGGAGAGADGAGAGGAGVGGAVVGGSGERAVGAGGTGAVDPGGTVRPRTYFSQQQLQPASPLPAPSPYTEQSSGLTVSREPASCPVSPVRTARHIPRSRHPPVPCTHAMALRPSSVPLHVPSAAVSALIAELLDFAAACRLDYATALVAESESASPPSVGGECALGTDVLEDRQEDFECLAATVPRFASMLLAPEGDPHAPDIPTLLL
ncbi:unnamed protein product [Closterium sp. NIES-54]